MERWYGKVAIVTGASVGIGEAIAVLLVKKGLKVAGFARRKEKVEELSKKLQGEKGQLHALKVDVSKEDEVVEGFKWVKKNLGPVHILVNNAGVVRNTTLIDGDYQKWKEVIDTNVLGLCVCTRESVRDMKENDVAGHIIHINSIAGHVARQLPPAMEMDINVYTASKFAVTALTEILRQELNNNKLKIKITSISPGLVETEILQAAGVPDNITKNVFQLPCLKSEDLADAVEYVLSTPPHVQVHELIIRPVGSP